MDSFFSTFLDKFKKAAEERRPDNARLGGRYFALILKEVIRVHPELLEYINEEYWKALGSKRHKPDDFTLITEKNFGSSTKTTKTEKRYADLYCLEQISGKKLFIEIKWKDEPRQNQIKDYLELIKADPENVFFSFLTLYDAFTDVQIVKKDIEGTGRNAQYVLLSKLRKNCCALCDQLFKKGKDTGVLKLFIKFLEDYTMSYSHDLNKRALLSLMTFSIGFQAWGEQRLRSRDIIQNIPEIMKCLVGNLVTLSDRFHAAFGGTGIYENSPMPYFYVQSKLPDISSPMQNVLLGSFEGLGAEDGEFRFQSNVTIKNSTTIEGEQYLSFGFYFADFNFECDPSVSFYAYTCFRKEEKSAKIKMGKNNDILQLPDEDTLYTKILSMLWEQVDKWLKKKENHNNKPLVKTCQELCKNLKNKLNKPAP